MTVGQFVLESSKLWNELSRKALLTQLIRIVWGKVIASETERACPQFGLEVYLAPWIKNSTTVLIFTMYWSVTNSGDAVG